MAGCFALGSGTDRFCSNEEGASLPAVLCRAKPRGAEAFADRRARSRPDWEADVASGERAGADAFEQVVRRGFADREGRQPSSSIAERLRARVWSRTRAVCPLTTLDTLIMETLARRATS
jgi:hypothetical protein